MGEKPWAGLRARPPRHLSRAPRCVGGGAARGRRRTAQITQHDITVVNPSALPAAASRISIGVRGDYKPWVTQLQNGELRWCTAATTPRPTAPPCTP